MKQLLLAASLLVLAGCSKNGDDPIPAPSILGTWNETNRVSVVEPMSGGTGTSTPETFALGEVVVVFNADGTQTGVSKAGGTVQHTYTYSGSTLAISDKQYTNYFTVKTLTATQLITTIRYNASPDYITVTETYSR
jgi:hypothetical protein